MASGDTRPLDLEHRAFVCLLARAELEKLGRYPDSCRLKFFDQ